MSREVHLVRGGEVLLAGVVENGDLTDLMAERVGEEARPGDIYLGRLERTVAGRGVAYVDLGSGNPALLPDAGSVAAKELMVQVVRAAHADKMVEVTRDISIPGIRLVYRPFAAGVVVSRKLDPASARSWMPDPPGGWIMRSAAAGSDEADIDQESSRLADRWRLIADAASGATSPCRIHRGPDVAARLILDTPQISAIRVDDDGCRKSLSVWLGSFAPELSESLCDGARDLPEEAAELLRSEVPLPKGGSIMIETTSALTAIDVDAGAASDAVQVNRQAARAIARQLRLRNICGIVVVDFISMKRREARNAVVDLFRGLLDDDPAHIRTSRGLSGLGLFELARERRGNTLADVLANW